MKNEQQKEEGAHPVSHSGFLNTTEEEPGAMKTHHHHGEQEDRVTAITETRTGQFRE